MAPNDNAELVKLLKGAVIFGTGLCAGATTYISAVEVKGRRSDLSPGFRLENWQQTVPRARDLLKPFGFVINAGIAGCYYLTKNPTWWISFGLFGFLGPWTAICIVPTNEKLASLKVGVEKDEQQAPALVEKWESVHFVRTCVSLLGFAAAIFSGME